jgi:hypothetical protein
LTIVVMAVDAETGRIHAGCDTNCEVGEGPLLRGVHRTKVRTVDMKPNDGTGDISGPTECLIGIAGRSVIGQFIDMGDVPITTPLTLDMEDLDRWAYGVAGDISAKAQEVDVRNPEDSSADYAGLLGFHGHLWYLAHYETLRLTPDLMAATTEDRPGWWAIGSGNFYALGALHACYEHVDAEEAVDRALHAASLDANCSGSY